MNIIGRSECTAAEMAAFLIAQNPNAKSWALEYATMYLEEGQAEGVRGDGAWIQSCKETHYFLFDCGTAVTFNQNNFCGLGVIRKGVRGCFFESPRIGIRAQIQHLKGYATSEPLNNTCVDSRYKYISKGCAPTFEELAGKWAVPGYDTSKASSLSDAMKKGIGYGFDIIAGIEKMKKIDTKEMGKVKILLISGHGAGDSGAVATIKGVTYKESDETIKLVELIHDRLRQYAYVDYYPVERNAYKDIQRGCLQVNFSQYDYVLEIHFNSCVKDLKGNGKTTGTEIFVTKTDNSAAVEQAIVNNIAEIGFKNRGVKKQNFTVINRAYKASAQSALLEVCFIDDADDMKLYTADRSRVADAIVEALITSYNLKGNSTSTTNKTQNVASSATTGASKAVGTSKECPFVVKCLDNLNIRQTPNGKIVKVDGCKKGIAYTITKVSGNWGFLKSGAGWITISSKYVKRV